MDYDIVIIGAGPGGSSAAIKFAKANLKTLLIDKQTFPRNKPCGGAFSQSLLNDFDFDLTSVIMNRVNTTLKMNNYKDVIKKTFKDKRETILVNRESFDNALLQHALSITESSLSIMQNTTYKDVKEYNDRVTIQLSDNTMIDCKYLIVADGAMSKVAKFLGFFQEKKYGLALDSEIIVTPEFHKVQSKHTIFNFFCIPSGYAWIFPKEDNKLSCGIVTWKIKDNNINLNKEFEKFLTKTFPANSILSKKTKGFPIPIFQGCNNIATKRVLFIGDAAGLVDPISGEGIQYAIKSGKIAAQLLIKNFHKDIDISKIYMETIKDKMGESLSFKLKFHTFVFNNQPDFYYKKFIKHQFK